MKIGSTIRSVILTLIISWYCCEVPCNSAGKVLRKAWPKMRRHCLQQFTLIVQPLESPTNSVLLTDIIGAGAHVPAVLHSQHLPKDGCTWPEVTPTGAAISLASRVTPLIGEFWSEAMKRLTTSCRENSILRLPVIRYFTMRLPAILALVSLTYEIFKLETWYWAGKQRNYENSMGTLRLWFTKDRFPSVQNPLQQCVPLGGGGVWQYDGVRKIYHGVCRETSDKKTHEV